MKDIWCLIIASIFALLVGTWQSDVWGHETDGFKHLDGDRRIGPGIIGARWCKQSQTYQVWSVDTNRDGEVDECAMVFGSHNKIHYKTYPAENGICLCKDYEKDSDL